MRSKTHRPFSILRTASRIGPAVFILTGTMIVWLQRDSIDAQSIRVAVDQGAFTVVGFLGVYILASLLFCPRPILIVASALLFGIWWGFLWAYVGTMLGATSGFWLARHIDHGACDIESVRRLGPLLVRAEQGGWRAVAILRLIPFISHSLQNYFLGVSRIEFGSFFIGSAVGQIPGTLNYVLVGGLAERLIADGANGTVVLIFVLSLAAGLGLFALLIRRWPHDALRSERAPQ
jgi:uncharacterized membrane protein YdjX (TVP38/TMEM64 family)